MDALAVVVEVTAEVAVARPAKRGTAGAAAAVAAVVGLKEKGAGKGTDAGGPRSPKWLKSWSGSAGRRGELEEAWL